MYTATKFFVEALTQSLRLETVGSGVKVTSIQPGMSTVELLYSGHLGDMECDKFGLTLCSVKPGLFYWFGYLIR